MLYFYIAVGALILLAALYLFLIAPNRRGHTWKLPKFYAHRGLHGAESTENGLEAFARACRAGIGIELDVRLTKDGEVVVFHDDTLERVLGNPAHVDQLTLSEIQSLRLPDGGTIPTLADVLKLVAGRVPLLVEVKNSRCIGVLCAAVNAQLQAYEGAYVMESFNPLALRWFKRHAKDVVRGQLVTMKEDYRSSMDRFMAVVLSSMLWNFLSRPDFIAYNAPMENLFTIRIQCKFFKTKLASWTVRTRSRFHELMRNDICAIFEEEQGEDPIQQLKEKQNV